MKRYIDECLAGTEGPRGKDFNMRWIASMVADVHRILTRGGIFIYPWDNRLGNSPLDGNADPTRAGKLRLMYEANPMAFIVEQAGGAASTGTQRRRRNRSGFKRQHLHRADHRRLWRPQFVYGGKLRLIRANCEGCERFGNRAARLRERSSAEFDGAGHREGDGQVGGRLAEPHAPDRREVAVHRGER